MFLDDSRHTGMIRTRFTLALLFSAAILSGCGAGGGGTSFSSSQRPAVAAAAPDNEVANAVANEPMAAIDAFRLLEQATFGPTLDDINSVASIGPGTWIDQQMQMPATFMSDGLARANSEQWNEYINVWWRHAIQAEDQLRQRVAFALSQIFVVSSDGAGLGQQQFGLANYYDILLRHSYGNYRDLLQEITLNPAMGTYLSMKGNQKPDPEQNIQPDENYAREVLQLFSIGQVMLNDDGTAILDEDGVPLPAYDQSTIENFARVFTGWHYANADHFIWPQNKDYISRMEPWEQYHDTDSKTLLNGQEVPAGLSASEDLKTALDNIFNHPNVGPFISRQLIQRLVTSNPSNEYVRDVARVFNSNHAGERGSLASTIKAILMHREARRGHIDQPTTFGKLKEPLIRMTQLWRAFEPASIPFGFNYGWVENEFSQAPLSSPSVFNFYRPDYSPPGEIQDMDLVSPEFQITDETSIIRVTNRLLASTLWSHNFKNDNNANRIAIDISHEMQLEPDRDAFLDHLDLLLLGGHMTPELRQTVSQMMDTRNYANAASQRVVEAIYLIVSSPEAALQF